jgi:hypothetical protein
MKRQSRFLSIVLALVAFAPAGAALATPIGGTASLAFDNGGTLSGYFSFDPTATILSKSVIDWQLTTTDFGTTTPHVYNATNTTDGASSFVLSNDNADQVLSFFQVFQDGSVQSTFELDLTFACGGVANCITSGAQNVAFTLVGGLQTCPTGTLVCISSGEQRPNAFGQHFLNSGVLNVTDPPGTFAFNVDSTLAPGFTLFTGGTGDNGGGGTEVPEPSTLLLFGAGALLSALRARRRDQAA